MIDNYQNIAKANDYEQLGFAPNGYIKPCPYIEKCSTYNIGCKGGCYWCGKFDKKGKRTSGLQEHSQSKGY